MLSPAVRAELAPSGKLRAGINFGNSLLANRDSEGNPHGIALELARELALRAELPMEMVSYEAAGKMADGVKTGAWDVAFLAVDPARSEQIAFTAPYLEVDTTYLVPVGSPLRSVADVDREETRISISDKSAYDLVLTRTIRRAQLVRAPGPTASVELFFLSNLDALAGLRPLLLELAEQTPGYRVLDGSFTTVRQAAGVPKQRTHAADYVRQFIEDIKTSGLVAEIIKKSGVRGVSVAPNSA
jgi:polar amino acid transport system substrate-binding protein